ncbi:hypothetical protein ACA910_018107 [Epithemia clementina (nom. ined.)]
MLIPVAPLFVCGSLTFRSNPTHSHCSGGKVLLYGYEDGQDNVSNEETWEGLNEDSSFAYNSQLQHPISDAEALLACKAFLQRRKRWGPWVKAENRKAMRRRYLGNMKELDNFSGKGFFWEDPSQLRYLNKNFEVSTERKPPTMLRDKNLKASLNGPRTLSQVEDEGQEELGNQGEEEQIWESVRVQGSMGRRDLFPLVEDERLLGDAAEEFSHFFEGGAPLQHVRRSEAALRIWADPEWKSRWYNKRWGKRHKSMDANARRMKQIENRIRHMDPSALENEGLANMTEEEIAEAVLQYIRLSRKRENVEADGSNYKESAIQENPVPALDQFVSDDKNSKREKQQKRSERARNAYKTRLENQKGNRQIETTMVPNDNALRKRQNPDADSSNDKESTIQENPVPALDQFVSDDKNAKREEQQKRSERARNAYKTRLENQKRSHQIETTLVPSDSALQSEATKDSHEAAPEQASHDSHHLALERIEACLNIGKLPEIVDVEIILKPARMSGRKKILLRILSDGFDLRGKCISSELSDSSQGAKFACIVPIAELGRFVLYKLAQSARGKAG